MPRSRTRARSLEAHLELLKQRRRRESASRVALTRERGLERPNGGAEVAERSVNRSLLSPEFRVIGRHRQHALDRGEGLLSSSGLQQPISVDFAPDGRVFVTEQQGRVRVIKDGQLLPEPFVTLDVSSSGERGVLGIELDPDFATNGYVYVFNTAKAPYLHNQVSRFTTVGDVAAAGTST